MVRQRSDGSIQSANTPARGTLASEKVESDSGMYRCMVVEVNFTDSLGNLTFDNKQVTYDCIILGGRKEGQVIPNCKLANPLGGQYNYHERILRKAENPFTGLLGRAPAEQKGDIVYVQFVQKTSNPVILGLGVHPLDKTTTGATFSDGPIWVEEYNGINRSINKDGEFELVRKGGTFNLLKGYFVPADRQLEELGGVPSLELFQARLKFSDGAMLWEDPLNSMEFKKNETLWTHIMGKGAYEEVINGLQQKTTRKYLSGMTIVEDGLLQKTTRTYATGMTITEDALADEFLVEALLGGKIRVKGATVALGSSAAELLDLVDQLLAALQVETHIGNLGVPTGVPL